MGTACCRTTLNYTAEGGGRSQVDVEVLDGRTGRLPGWEVCGFELLEHASAVTDWQDDDEITAVHHPELEQLARELTGCDHATVTNHIKRGPEAAARHADLAPIAFVHSDFAAGYDALIRRSMREAPQDELPAMTRNGLTAESFEQARRIVVLQFWRNIGAARMDLPIAFCDARTLRPDEARPVTVRDYAGAGGPTFDALAILAPEDPQRHRWYAFPELGRDEVIAFRTYDTELVASGATYFTPHSAFRDPDVPRGEPARRSIEARATCLFD